MSRWKLTEPEYWAKAENRAQRVAIVSLAAVGRWGRADIVIEGHPEFVERVQASLDDSRGDGGHILHMHTTQNDLACAMDGPQLSKFAPELLEESD